MSVDAIDLAGKFGKTGPPGWIPEDIMADGVIDMFDANLVARMFNWGSANPGQIPAPFPLTWPLKVHAYNANFTVPVYSDYIVKSNTWSFNSVSRQFSFDVTSEVDGFCNVTMPATLMSGAFSVYLDGVPTSCGVSTNVTHYFIYFTSTGFSNRVTIESTIVGAQDVAVTNVASSKTAVGQGFSASMNVTVANQGFFTETFNVTAFANATIIGSEDVTLSAGDSTTIMFLWNTTGFAYGNYTLSAYAWPVPGETDTADNNLTGGTIYVGLPGDVNGDGIVDIYDAIILAGAYNSKPGDPNWNPNTDINNDGIVDIYDAIILAGNYNKTVL